MRDCSIDVTGGREFGILDQSLRWTSRGDDEMILVRDRGED